MRPAISEIRLIKGPARFLAGVLARAIEDLEEQGLTLAIMEHREFMEINKALEHRGWYPLHDHYGHDRFRGLAITDLGFNRCFATIASRPLDLNGRSVGEAYEDLTFPYPTGVPIGARDRFDNIPLAAYGLKGNGVYVGGIWIDPDARHGGTVGRELKSGLLSYLTRSLYAWSYGTEDPDFFFGIVIDDLLRGREHNKSTLDRYGWRFCAPGPNWVYHYPNADLPVNTTWIDRAGILECISETPWVKEAAIPGREVPAAASLSEHRQKIA